MLEDVNTGIAWCCNRITKYHGDPDCITLVGQSAGGHLSCLALLKQASGGRGLLYVCAGASLRWLVCHCIMLIGQLAGSHVTCLARLKQDSGGSVSSVCMAI